MKLLNSKIKRVENILDKKGIDCIITSNSSHIFYLTGIYGLEGYLCFGKGNLTFFTSGIYLQYALDKQKTIDDFNFEIEKIDRRNFYKFLKDFKKPAAFISEITYQKWKTFSVKTKGRLKVIDDFLIKMRAIKEPGEIVKIKKAQNIAAKVMRYLKKIVKPDISELDITAEIFYQIRKLGGDKEAFQPIVASGINSSYPHHLSTRKKIKEDEVVVIDVGVCVDGYNSDITLTLILGNPSRDTKRVSAAINHVHQYVGELISNGETSCKKLHQSAMNVLEKYGLQKFFVHGLGHGIGIDVHELPVLSINSKDTLKKNMVFTIEPGIYIPGKFGMRVEKMVYFN